MTHYDRLLGELPARPATWLITGVAGFIGSHLLETLLRLDQHVVGMDNLASGFSENLEDVRSQVTPEQWERFMFFQGSVGNAAACVQAARGVDFILHQAGFVSVPLSIEDPVTCHDTNVSGVLNILAAARENGVPRVVYASSSAVYGDDARMPKIEPHIGRPLSPYGAAKWMGEIYAGLFGAHYGLSSVGLRYFNVFGPRQNPQGGYAAVIPQWISALVEGRPCKIHGDGSATRDFCHVSDIVQANLLAATAELPAASAQVYNVALGGGTNLNALYAMIAGQVSRIGAGPCAPVEYGPERAGDILHSSADVSKIRAELGFEPQTSVERGLEETVRWYAARRLSIQGRV